MVSSMDETMKSGESMTAERRAESSSMTRVAADAEQQPPLLSTDGTTQQQRLWQTALRESITPFLPPPVTRTIVQHVDPVLAPYVGPEATVTVAATLFAAWLLLWIGTRLLLLVSTRTGRAVADDGEDQILLSSSAAAKVGEEFEATVVLTGPRNAGKTRLFYQLCYSESNMPTLMSVKANVGIAAAATDSDDIAETTNKSEAIIRYMDWPGHASVNDPSLVSVLTSKSSSNRTAAVVRIVLVLDATQPVSAAADILYQLLTILHKNSSNNSDASRKKTSYPTTAKNSPAATPTIFIACHKKDLAKAKNDRRIKIQLRTELERLLTANAAAGETAAWCRSGQPLDLDTDLLPFVNLYFGATTCCEKGNTKGSPELMEFCQTGVVPTKSPKP